MMIQWAKGVLEDGTEIAVKRLSKNSSQALSACSGYMSPEYALDGVFSVKSDVFSFGVLLLEIVSGKKNRAFIQPENNNNLIGYVS
ncbi:hypothetical protein L1987_43703 [Smallanthus sonchifolius]|uniref:Uncharacterized protein n=1 Tax=Smallanthus sonchifolius TaxID=185202 RepID=A0ACB9GNL8_9ASTR|nr:hypothetical protein L1987_43703 [Smallanthus sonchifolius]